MLCGVYCAAVIVLQGATVKDLLKAFEIKVKKQCAEQGRTTHLNWCVLKAIVEHASLDTYRSIE